MDHKIEERTFAVAAPRVWKQLLCQQSWSTALFKHKLTTFLFMLSHGISENSSSWTVLCAVGQLVGLKGKGFPYSLPSVESGADPGVQAVSPQVTISHPPSGRLPLLSARSAVTFPPAEHHRPLAGTKLYCLVTETHRCEQLARGCYTALTRLRSQVQRSTCYAICRGHSTNKWCIILLTSVAPCWSLSCK